jgi:hypothetical protein
VTALLDTVIAVLLFVSTTTLVGYAVRTAWLDHKQDALPHEVLHRYNGRPHEGWYFAEFENRAQAQAYLWELAATEGVTEAHIVPSTCS